MQSKPRKSDIARVEYLHVDADPNDDESPDQFKARLRPKIEAFPQQPTFVVDSGNGIQLLWRLRPAVKIGGDEVIKDIEARNYALALAFGADPSTRNIDRIFRLPGTTNYPNGKKREIGRVACKAKLIKYKNVAYPLSAFPPHRIDETVATTDSGCSTELSANLRTLLVVEGKGGYPSRNELVFAFMTGAIRADIADATIIETCLDQNFIGKGIYQHIKENGGRKCAERQLRRAHAKVGAGRNAEHESIHSWDGPDLSILDDRRGELPNFPIAALRPEQLRQWVKRAAHGTGTTVDHVAVPLVGIASSLIGTARRVQASRSWSQPMTNWAGTVGFSGSGKTPGLGASKDALDQVEESHQGKINQQRRQHELRVEEAKAAKAKWKKEFDEAIKRNRRPPPKPAEADEPPPFVDPRLYVIDTTIEEMAILLQARPTGMSLIVDELSSLFQNMSRYSGGQDDQFWLMSWDGKSHSVDRVGRASIKLEHLLIGIVGGMQPDKFAECFAGAADGMYARFLWSWPDKAPYRELTDEIEEVDPGIVGMLDRLARVAKQVPPGPAGPIVG